MQPSTTASQPCSFIRSMTLLKCGHRLRLEDSIDQFIHDDAIDLFAVLRVRAHILQVTRLQLFRIHLALDQIASAGQAQAPEAATDGLGCDRISDVQPAQR